jgi:surface polysaccharide O-acyltransferase-like enzyme
MFLIVFQHQLIPLVANSDGLSKAFFVFGHIAVPSFVLISGYFGINASIKGFLNLYFRCILLGVGLYFAYCIFGHKSHSLKQIIKAFLPFSHSNLWFIQTYIILYIMSPIINIALNIASQNQKMFFIIITGVITFWFGWVNQNNTLADGKNVVNFIFLYCIGNYIHYNIDKKIIVKNRYIILLLYVVLNTVLFVVFSITGNYLIFQKIMFKIFFYYNSPGVIINASLLFLFFSTITLKSRTINWFGESVLSVYVIHRNLYFGPFLAKILFTVKTAMGGEG